MALGVVIPAFNEAEKIGAVLADMPEKVNGHDVLVLVVDDGSTDGTSEVASRMGVEVYIQKPNQGKGAALRRGMEEAKVLPLDVLVWMDSDGQHRPKDLARITLPVLAGEADMVVGSRYMTPSKTKAPLNRRLVRDSTIRAVRQITGEILTDPFSGFRAFSRRAVAAIELCGNGYESELEALFCVARAGLTVQETPIDRIYGPNTSKMGFHRGRILGRMTVIGGYARTVAREWVAGDQRTRTAIG